MRAVTESIPATGGVLIQFPFYAVIFGMIVGTGIADALTKLFASISTHNTYPLLVAMYSAVLGVFIPSGGSKWVVEAPYVLQAANLQQVHLGWVVQIYNASEALPNLINPFWMLPLVGHTEVEGPGHCGIWSAAVDRSRTGRVLSCAGCSPAIFPISRP
jgi:short-chain fatty acids transporter